MHCAKGCVQVHIFLNKRQCKSLIYTCCTLVRWATLVAHVNNQDVVNSAITKGLIKPEILNWCHSIKLKSIKSISEYAAKKQSPPSLPRMSLCEDLLWRHWSASSRTHQSWELAGSRRGGLSFEMLIFSRFCCGKWRGLRVVEWGWNKKKVARKNKPKADKKFFTTWLSYRNVQM